MPLSPVEALKRRDELLAAIEGEAKTTLRVLKAIPPNQLAFKPHPRSMGMGELAWHIAWAESWFVGSILKGTFKEGAGGTTPGDVSKEPPNSVAGLAAAYEKLTAARVAELKTASGEVLGKDVDFMGIAKLPAIKYMEWCIHHSIHHRGQLSVYLRLAGGKVPSIYGPSADENPFA